MHLFRVYTIEMTMRMVFPVEMGILWKSHENANKTPTWEWKREGVGMNVDGNGHDPYSHGKNSTDFVTLTQ